MRDEGIPKAEVRRQKDDPRLRLKDEGGRRKDRKTREIGRSRDRKIVRGYFPLPPSRSDGSCRPHAPAAREPITYHAVPGCGRGASAYGRSWSNVTPGPLAVFRHASIPTGRR